MVNIEEYFESTEKLYMWSGFQLFQSSGHILRNKIRRQLLIFIIISCDSLLLAGAVFSEDLMDMTESLLICIIIFNAGNKFINILIKELEMVKTFVQLRKLVEDQLKVNWKKEILVNSKARVDWLQKMFLWNFGICVIAAILNTIVDNIRHPENLRFPLKMWFPLAPNSGLNLTIGTIYQTICSCAGIIIFTFGYMTFTGLIIHISSQIIILSKDMRNISAKANVKQKEMLKNFIRHHQIILRLVKSTNNVLGNVLFLEIILSSMQTCLVAFNCFQRPLNDPKQAFFVPFLLCTTILPASICWCGQLLMTKSDDLINAIYDCEWYAMPPKIRRDILMIQIQASNSMTLNARNTFVMAMPTFLKTLQTAYSYLTMLTATDK
uniref:Odorant receptor n=1 Tax=Rhodnius prolixus TaxID=13249 RepID=T1H891_RHOPR